MKSLVFKTAWQMRGSYTSFAEALKQAWAVIKLKYKMLNGVVEFTHRKVDGSIRHAVGTLHASYVNYQFKGNAVCMVEFDEEQGKIIGGKFAIIDGKTLKQDTYYTLKKGEFIEVI